MKQRSCPECGAPHKSENPYCADHAHLIDKHTVRSRPRREPKLYEEFLDDGTTPSVSEEMKQ